MPSGIAEYMAAYVVIVMIAHLAMRRFAPWADPLLLPLAALLNGLGIVMTYRLGAQGNRLSAPLSPSATHDPDRSTRPSASAASSRCSS